MLGRRLPSFRQHHSLPREQLGLKQSAQTHEQGSRYGSTKSPTSKHGMFLRDIRDENYFEEEEEMHESSEAAAFDYILVFPHLTGALEKVTVDRISYAEAKNKLINCVAGGEAHERVAIEEFRKGWMAKFRTAPPQDTDTVPRVYFLELVREIIVSRLESVPGLHLQAQRSKNADEIYVTLRASRQLLIDEADRRGSMCPIWSEVDPGEEYWHRKENLSIDEYSYSRKEASNELYRLFLTGKIPAEEAQIFPDELPSMWSKRINVLHRLNDSSIKITRKYPIYFPFHKTPRLQHLYAGVEGCAAKNLFRNVDKIRLTKEFVDHEFNCEMMKKEMILKSHLCMHSYKAEGNDLTLISLYSRWGSLMAPYQLYVSGETPVFRVLTYQPVADIRDYFGEQIALYFGYLEFYTESVVVLCILAMLHQSCQAVVPSSWLAKLNLTFSFVSCLFSAWFVQSWSFKQHEYSIRWGTYEAEEDLVFIPYFKGRVRISPIDNRPELYARPFPQAMRKMASVLALKVLILAVLYSIYGIFALQRYLETTQYPHATTVGHVCQAGFIFVASRTFHTLAVYLNDFENHKTHRKYDRSLTLKYAVFQTFNYYGSTLGTLFFKKYLFGCQASKNGSCIVETEHLLSVILRVMFALNLFEIGLPFLRTKVYASFNRFCCKVSSEMSPGDHQSKLLPKRVDKVLEVIQKELELDEYDGVLEDYAEVVMVFGYTCWFTCISPFVAINAFFLALLETRIDAFKMCTFYQRPAPIRERDIGPWFIYLQFLSFFGIFVNTAVVVLTQFESFQANHPRFQEATSWEDLFSKAILYFMGFLVGWGAVYVAIDTHPSWLKEHILRNKYLHQKHIHGIEEIDIEKLTQNMDSGDVFLNGVYRHIITGCTSEGQLVDSLREAVTKLDTTLDTLSLEIQEQQKITGDSLGRLRIQLKRINILPVMDTFSRAVDPFIKLAIVECDIPYEQCKNKKRQVGEDSAKKTHKDTRKVLAKRLSKVLRKNRSPEWNETFALSVDDYDAIVAFEVYDWDRLGKNTKLSSIELHVRSFIQDLIELQKHKKRLGAHSSEGSDFKAFTIPIQLSDKLLATMEKDIQVHGKPQITFSLAFDISTLGRLKLQKESIEEEIAAHDKQLKQFLTW